MTTPNQSPPGGAYIIGDGNSFGQGLTPEDAMNQMTGQASVKYNAAAGEWGAVRDGIGDQINTIRDGQLTLGERVDLLEGVHGYANLYMDKNWYVTGTARRVLPFNTQLGPTVRTTLESSGIRLATRGLWRADCLITFAPGESSFFSTNPSPVEIYLQVINAVSTSVYTEHRYDCLVSTLGAETAAFAHTFVIPSDNEYLVRVQVRTDKTRVYTYGGTARSGLSVNKWSTNTDAPAVAETVADGGSL